MNKKSFWEKKGRIWLFAIVLGIVALIWALMVDLHPGKEFISWGWWPEIRSKLWEASEKVCDVVIAYSTMLTAVVIFYYSVTENKRLGVPYRRLTANTVGSLTIPVLFVVTLFLTVFAVVSRHIPWKHTTYVCVIYILVLQTFMISQILCSTSYEHGKRVICREERKNYDKKVTQEEYYSINRVYSTGYLELAIHSEEIIQDKKELLEEFLRIPFKKGKGELSPKNFCQEVFIGKEEQEKIYRFYFLNISSAFHNLGGKEKTIERNELYLSIGGFLKELYKCLETVVNLKQNGREENLNTVYHMVLSGIMNGMVYSDIEDNAVFCNYIFEKCIPNKLSVLQLRLYVLFQEVMDMFEEGLERKSPKIKKLVEWEPIRAEENISIYADFWDIWVRMFNNIPLESKMKHFKMAMQTMTGRSVESQAVLQMLLPMGKK